MQLVTREEKEEERMQLVTREEKEEEEIYHSQVPHHQVPHCLSLHACRRVMERRAAHAQQ
jgi:hypothetical protein